MERFLSLGNLLRRQAMQPPLPSAGRRLTILQRPYLSPDPANNATAVICWDCSMHPVAERSTLGMQFMQTIGLTPLLWRRQSACSHGWRLILSWLRLSPNGARPR